MGGMMSGFLSKSACIISRCRALNTDYSSLVFRWIAIPFVQVQLDLWLVHRNKTKPRKDRHKVTPHGIPELLRAKPDFFGIVDFKVSTVCMYLQVAAN